MGQIVRKKKGRPSKTDLAARAAAESNSGHRSHHRRDTEEEERREARRSLRQRSFVRYNLIDYDDEDYLDDDDDEFEFEEDDNTDAEDGGRKREKKLKFVLKLPNCSSRGRPTRSNGGFDSAVRARGSDSEGERDEEDEEEEEEIRVVKKRKITRDMDDEEEVDDDSGDNDDEEIWLYEAVPGIGEEFANRVSKTALPRMLRWTADDENLSYETIQSRMDPENSENIKVEDNPILVPKAGEYELMLGCFYRHEEPDLYFDDIEAALAPTYDGFDDAFIGAYRHMLAVGIFHGRRLWSQL